MTALKRDPTIWAAVEYGPPTLDLITKRDPSAPRTRAVDDFEEIKAEYAAANKTGFELLIQRLDFNRRPTRRRARAGTSGRRPITATRRTCSTALGT